MTKQARDLALFMNVRLSSRRCPRKMIRPFAGTNLVDLCLDRLEKLAWPDMYYAAHDRVLLERAEGRSAFKVYARSEESAESHSDPHKIFEVLRHIPHPYVMWVNPCGPFMRVETLQKAIEHFLSIPDPAMTTVRELKGWFFDASSRLINDVGGGIDTALSRGIQMATHSFHFYDREFMVTHGRPWDFGPGVPRLFTVTEEEAFDIDTEEEFAVGEALYRHRFGEVRG